MSSKRSDEQASGKMSGNLDNSTNTRTALSDTPAQPYSKSTAEPSLQKKTSSSRLPLSHSPATGSSPYSSRNTSPQRKESKQNLSTAGQVATQPSAAAIQRALSASNVPQLASAAAAEARVARTQRSAGSASQVENASSPRLMSPSPGNSKRVAATSKKSDTPPSINIQSANSDNVPTAPQTAPLPRKLTPSEQQLQTPAKLASRGPSGKSVLETVDEDGADAEPTAKIPSDLKPLTKVVDEDGKNNSEAETAIKSTESGSESGGGNDRPARRSSISSVTKQSMRRAKNSYTSLAGSKVRQSDVPHNMTVETETVQSIPHSGLNVSSERANKDKSDGNVLRVKSSTETIRPRKERRQPTKKARSINQGVASSKADIFEARVANAVDEANSSDSDETYVYESNPPESRRPRHHSRTPSVTSAHSTVENRGIRNVGDVLDERKVAGKRSMKFSNNPFNSSSESPTTDRQDGTVRSHHARHYGRFGRGGNHAAMFDPESPYTQASRLRSNPHSLRQSRPGSPRSPQTTQVRSATATPIFGKRKDNPFGYDEGDDERTPLMNTVRTPRSFRDPNRLDDGSTSGASLDAYYGIRRRSRCGTLGGCLLGVLIFALVVVSTVVFLFMSNRALGDVYIRRIENVLASEQELMLDLRVGAVNPNALSIAIGDMDINIFAKSKYLDPPSKKTEASARMRSRSQLVDEAIDTYDAPKKSPDNGSDFDSDSQTMLLGRILHFDQELNFAGSPISYRMHYSVGELRLAHPGNKTESGGSARWNRVLHHPFELIVRGVLKYKLPVSGREETAAIRAGVLVHPEDGVDSMGRMRLEPVDHSDHWQWIDWDREKDMLDSIRGESGEDFADNAEISSD